MSQIRELTARYEALTDKKFAIASSQFNRAIVDHLQAAAVETLCRHGVDKANITVAYVPGAFELPFVCKQFALRGEFSAIIALGCVIRGATTHYDYVCSEVAKGVAAVGYQYDTPTIFGVLTTDTIEQAIERSGTKMGNKGAEAATAAVEMVSVLAQLKS